MKMTHNFKLTAVALAAAFGLALTCFGQDAEPALPPASTTQDVTYDNTVKAIFDASCVKCHNGADKAKKPKAGLALNSLEGALKGGKHGKVIIPGDSAKSDLVLAVAHATKDHDKFMPKGHGAKKLSDEQIGLIRAWIDQGAK